MQNLTLTHEELAATVAGRSVSDAGANRVLDTMDWNHVYPIAVNGLYTGDVASDDSDGYIIDRETQYMMPESEAIAAGYDAENQSW